MTDWVWLGDHLAVDFANTVKVVHGARVELIGTVEDLASWVRAEPAAPPDPGRLDDQALARIHALRDEVLVLLHAAVGQEPLPAAAVTAVNEAVRAASTTRLLGPAIGRLTTQALTGTDTDRFLGALAAAAVDLLGRDDLANLAICHAPECGQFFHRSRPNQRWCSPGCGNRARVDRHRHRKNPRDAS